MFNRLGFLDKRRFSRLDFLIVQNVGVLRKEAYRYIQERLSKLPVGCCDADQGLSIPLDELTQLKEGVADPSVVLVATFKQLFKGTATEAEIDAHLVKPFREEKR